jgi:hypothetical protein
MRRILVVDDDPHVLSAVMNAVSELQRDANARGGIKTEAAGR